MWWADALLYMVGIAVWNRAKWPLPPSDVEMVVKTYLVLEQPLPTITVTFTETVGVVATAITHAIPAIPATSSTPVPESDRSTIDGYSYPSPDYTRAASRTRARSDELHQDRTTAMHVMWTPQYSTFDVIAIFAAVFSAAVMASWIAIIVKGKDHVMQSLGQIPEYIDASFRHTGCRIGYACLILAWVGLITDYCIGWSEGYVVWPKIIKVLFSYPLLLIAHFQLPPIGHILFLCGRFAKTVATAPVQWMARQARRWYEARTSTRRIDRVFDRPITRITIGECLFPDLAAARPRQPDTKFAVIIKAALSDIFFLGWNLIVLVIKLRIRSWMQIWSHSRDVSLATMEGLFGGSEDAYFWDIWLGCYQTGLKGLREMLSVSNGLIKTALGGIWVGLKLVKAVYNRALIRLLERKVPDNLAPREIKSYEDNVHNAYCETSTYNHSQIALLLLRQWKSLEDIARLEAQIKYMEQHYDSINSREIGEKCVGYRATIIELVHDNNYFRLLLCAILNALYNELHGRRPNDLNAKHPYQPSQLEFRVKPDPRTGFYMGYREYTVRAVNKWDLGREYLKQVENFGMKYEKEPFRMSMILAWKANGPGNVPDNFDPFVKDHWVFSGAIPGLNIPVYKSEHNPFNIHEKRFPVYVNPEGLFGPQIEDFAAKGQLAQWGDPEAMKPKVAPFDAAELRKFTAKMDFGTAPPRKHKMVSLPKMPAYSSDPCPTGEPRTTDFPLYRKDFA
ncbi:uncharacterized protein J4E84_003161 [Alternaria hordeiaustralica]|uniref:uncharacterized protein n=1 Tax=Alternaria hordeiaustralica TaxID=1187925 RepID=UPI0020C2BADF|nr:uncharacterized protein J4E84_003161 [Alternaria hordeiaustralica]KAI4692193.1 hypothetical protein J4E84_003161 [Alternaria hordeiaustralica]